MLLLKSFIQKIDFHHLFVIAGIGFAGCSSYSINPLDPSINLALQHACHDPVKQQVDGLAAALMKENASPGLAIALQIHGGEPQFFNYGYTDTTHSHQITEHSLFAVGSITKGFTAEYTAMEVARGVITWNETLNNVFAKDGLALSADAKNITVEQLASHTSGLPRQVNDLSMLTDLMRYVFTGDQFYQQLDNGKSLYYLGHFVKDPQSKVEYSNLGFAVLDKVLAEQTNLPVQEGITARILEPLAMNDSSFYPETLPHFDLRALGHAGDQPKFLRRGATLPEWRFQRYMVGAASLWSTSADLLKYAVAHYDDHTPEEIKAAFADALTVRQAQQHGESVALGWLRNDVYGRPLYYQAGFIGGYSSYIALDPENRNAIVILQNSFNWTNTIGHRMMSRLALKDRFGCGGGEQDGLPAMTGLVALGHPQR